MAMADGRQRCVSAAGSRGGRETLYTRRACRGGQQQRERGPWRSRRPMQPAGQGDPARGSQRPRRAEPGGNVRGSVTGARSPPLHACHVVATDLGIRARGKNCGTETGACPCGTGRARRRSGVGAGTTSPFPFGLTRLTMQKLQNREYNSKNSKYKVVDEKSLYNNCKGRHMFW
jgi:hypothetical protein